MKNKTDKEKTDKEKFDELDEKEKKKLNALFSQLVKSEIEKKLIESENEKNRSLAVEAMQIYELKEFELENVGNSENAKNVNIAKIQLLSPKSIVYDINAVLKEFDKEEANEFVDSVYTINDVAGLKKALKKYGVPNTLMKKHIIKNSKVNEAKLKKLYELGDISIKRLAKCYTVVEKNDCIKVTFKNKR